MSYIRLKTWFISILALLPMFAWGSSIEKLDIEFDFFADEEGAEKVYVSIAVPEKDMKGNPINKGDIARIDVYRKYQNLAFSVDNPVPGDVILHVDEGVKQGEQYTYYLIATTDEGKTFNIQSYRVIYVGFDVPEPVSDVVYTVDGNDVELSWTAPSRGAYHGVLKLDQLRYDISREVKGESVQVAHDLTETCFSERLPYDQLTAVRYVITPKTDTGNGEPTTSARILVGAAHKTPFVETFSGGQPDNDTWVTNDYWYYDDKYTYNPITNKADVKSYDNDGGMLNVSAYVYGSPKTYRIQSGPVDVSGCKEPVLEFYYYAMANRPNSLLNIRLLRDGATDSSVIHTIDYSSDTEGWQVVHVPLSAYRDSRNIAIEFEAIAGSDVLFAIDCIRIDDIATDNLSIKYFKIPSESSVGEDAEVKVTVANTGLNMAEGYTLRIMRDDVTIKEFTDESLAGGKSKQFVYLDPVTNGFAEEVSYTATLEYAKDGDISDNTSGPLVMSVTRAILPAVTDLSGTPDSGSGEITLTWSEPSYMVADVDVTEDFEAYPNYAISGFGDWKTIDRDQSQTYSLIGKGLKYSIETYPDYHAPKAFQLFDTDEVADPNTTYPWKALSGKKVLASMAPYYGAKDDWLISPRLSGDAQTISLNVLAYNDNWGAEEVFVYGSKYSDAEEDFDMTSPLLCDNDNPLSGYKVTNTVCKKDDYRRLTVDLPKGTRYFAIRVATPSNDGFLLIDDISYSAARAGVKLQLLGYNIYCDGRKVNDTPVSGPGYTLKDVRDVKTCHVCAVYDHGESEPSNIIDLSQSGIGSVGADGTATVNVFDLSGRQIISNGSADDLRNLHPGFYIVNGTKTIIR